MDLKLVWGVAATALALLSLIPYLSDILKRRTQPHAYSWLVWSLLQIIAAAAAFKAGAGYGAWAISVGAGICFLVFVLSFKYGTKNVTRFDTVCLIASLIIMGLYLGIENPLWAVIAVTIVDFAGYLPTFRKGFQEPWTETPITFFLSAFSQLLSIFALQEYSITTTLYIASLLLTNSVFVTMILIRRSVLKTGTV